MAKIRKFEVSFSQRFGYLLTSILFRQYNGTGDAIFIIWNLFGFVVNTSKWVAKPRLDMEVNLGDAWRPRCPHPSSECVGVEQNYRKNQNTVGNELVHRNLFIKYVIGDGECDDRVNVYKYTNGR